MDSRATVVMINFRRPHNVLRFAREYRAHPAVDSVLVWDASPSPAMSVSQLRADGIRVIEDPLDVGGLPARFAAAGLARTTYVLLVDDDIALPPATVQALHDARHPDKVVGIFGRRPDEDGAYNVTTCYGDVPVVLTRAAVVPAALCSSALSATVSMSLELGGEPFGNGEDIVLSFTALARQKAKGVAKPANLALCLPFENAGYADGNAISVRYAQHVPHRTRVLRWCTQNILGAVFPCSGSRPMSGMRLASRFASVVRRVGMTRAAAADETQS